MSKPTLLTPPGKTPNPIVAVSVCSKCGGRFVITEIDLPDAPTECPSCWYEGVEI
jgi:DNA-directed RNA polymerase subunit RPC12/RpoP